MTDYPFTEEELSEQITKIWEHNKEIDYQAISDFFRRNDWKWGGCDEPKYIPEFRDIKNAIWKGFSHCREYFLKQFFTDGAELDYETTDNVVSINGGKLKCEMGWTSYYNHEDVLVYEPSFTVSIEFDVAAIGLGIVDNYLSKKD